MIRTIISLFLLILCSHNLFGQSYRDRMRTAIDLGSHSVPFVYTDTLRDMRGYTNDYYCSESKYPSVPCKDVFYKLTLTRSMDIYFNYSNSSFSHVDTHILNASGKEIEHMYGSTTTLLPGTYYFVLEPAPESIKDPFIDGFLGARIEVRARKTGEDFSWPNMIGTFDSDFIVSPKVIDLYQYAMDYNLTGDSDIDDYLHDVVHQFTITQPMEVTMGICGSNPGLSGLNYYHSALMSSQTDSISESYRGSGCSWSPELRYELDPGTYYIYSWGNTFGIPNDLVINLNGKIIPVGSDFRRSIDVGSYSSDFTYTHTHDTSASICEKLFSKPGNEAFYRLVLTSPMELTVDNCGSSVADTYLSVYSSDKKCLYSNDDSNGVNSCDNPQSACLHIPALLPGTYYVVTDGAKNGNVTTSIRGRSLGQVGDKLITAIDAGRHEGGFLYSDTRDTSSGYTHQFSGQPTNDVFYKFTLENPVDLLVSHCGSIVADTYLSILNSNGAVLYSNDNYVGTQQCGNAGNALISIDNLAAGTYYVVSESNTENGFITTNIEAYAGYSALSTTMGQPHIISFIPTIASDDVLSLGTDEVRHDIQYYDYFGNPTVNVRHGFSPYGNDLLTLRQYDGLGRESELWLPVTKESVNGSYVDPGLLKESAKRFFLYDEDANPYSHTVYDGSALNEVVEQYGPGEAWHTATKSVLTDRITNLSAEDAEVSLSFDAVARIYQAADSAVYTTGIYPTATLHVTKTTDEDGHVSLEFLDKSGRTMLTRKADENGTHDTYMVYDGFGNIRFVLPPMAVDGLTGESSWNEDHDVLQQYAYIYHYDKYNRPISKKLPGCDPIYIVYDSGDRPIFTQDGNQREKGEWAFNVMDTFNRIVLTGTCKNELDYKANPLGTNVVKAVWANVNNTSKGYSIMGVTLNTPTVLSANYYDTYAFLGLNSIPDTISSDSPTRYVPIPGYGERYNGSTKGLQTGSWTVSLSGFGTATTPSLYAVMYYDDRYRLIQQKGNNVLGGTEQAYTAYNFVGQPTQVTQVRTVPGKEAITETRKHVYDNAGRLLRTTYQLDNDAPVTLVNNVYDEVGRLKSERRNGNSKLRTDYAYNLRSWTKSINGSLLSQTLNYQEVIEGNTPCYNGNISSMLWRSGNEGNEKGYHFTYDGLSRLKNANYGEGTGLVNNINRFNEQITGYDKMGNILGLLRYGQTSQTDYGLIDNLNLTYSGNQLQAVRDNATNSVFGNGLEFKDGAHQAIEYTYDKNGNLIKDLNKNISNIQYNLLNLPSQVSFAGGNRIDYEYAVNGSKLRTVHTSNGAAQTTDYCGNAIYENGELKVLLNEAGYVSFPDKKFHFYLKDHQGNVRVVADKDGNVEETNAYYPFGGTFTSTANVQPYKYNGKELDTNNGLNWYDYGARHYDAAIGRWHAVDPRAEKYSALSPYNYCGNNPVNYVDLKGDSISLADMQNLDKSIGTNFVQKIVNDLQVQTGLTIAVGNDGVMTYAKDANGNPIVATMTDANGNSMQAGSAIARAAITNALDHSNMVEVVDGRWSGVDPQKNNTVRLGIKQIEGFVKGTTGMDNRTLGWGMTLTHELHHTQVGGGLKDNYTSSYPGDVVTQMNAIRSELNAQGGNYGQRLDYAATKINGYNYVPFDRAAQGQTSLGLPPLPINRHIKFK